MSTFSNAARTALAAVRALKSEPILYDDDRLVPLALVAAVGSTTFRQNRSDHSSLVTRTVDFLVDASQFTRDGLRIEPRTGDTITRTDTGEIHEVISINDEPCWRWSDTGQTQLRIHTHKTGETTPAP